MDKFLFAENEMSGTDEQYIVHALPPFSLIRAVEGSGRIKLDNRLYQSFAFRNIGGVIEDWTLVIYFTEATHEQAEKLLSKAWRWYRSYMEWQDEQRKQNENDDE